MRKLSNAPYLIQFLWVGFIPIVELFALRTEIRRIFGANNLILGLYFNDVFYPLILSSAIIFKRLYDLGVIHLEFQKAMMLKHGVIVLVLGLSLFLFDLLCSYSPYGIVFSILTLSLATFFTATQLFIDPKVFEISATHRRLLVLSLVSVGSLLIYPFIVKHFWMFLAQPVGWLVHQTLNLIGLQNEFVFKSSDFSIQFEFFRARIAMACSGLEGIFFFISFYSAYLVFDDLHNGERKIVRSYLMGVVMMIFLNVLRIVLFFCVAVLLLRNRTPNSAYSAFVWLFHSNIGWILYLIGFLGFIFLQERKKFRPASDARAH